jgi:hypothetical protein
MKIEAYDSSPIQSGDLVLGYRPGAANPALRLSGVFSTGETGAGTYVETVEVPRADIYNLEVTPYGILSAPAGFGARLLRPAIMVVNPDGTPFTTASGQQIQVINSTSLAIGTFLSAFGFSATTSSDVKTWSGQLFQEYEVVTGPISVISTENIGGGGTNATMTFTLYYELIELS